MPPKPEVDWSPVSALSDTAFAVLAGGREAEAALLFGSAADKAFTILSCISPGYRGWSDLVVLCVTLLVRANRLHDAERTIYSLKGHRKLSKAGRAQLIDALSGIRIRQDIRSKPLTYQARS